MTTTVLEILWNRYNVPLDSLHTMVNQNAEGLTKKNTNIGLQESYLLEVVRVVTIAAAQPLLNVPQDTIAREMETEILVLEDIDVLLRMNLSNVLQDIIQIVEINIVISALEDNTVHQLQLKILEIVTRVITLMKDQLVVLNVLLVIPALVHHKHLPYVVQGHTNLVLVRLHV